ncbi:peptidase G1 [Boletus reticuloceps]|uniref:Peptidase G1 n=1 Tax=Boletus reticuloceps TaxID=495285 RepID=A0A8I2YM89_9AGAM|nr:peptidase G1 [Boletus reticuloceps]
MRFNSVIISSFFASAVLAAPGRERRSWSANTTLDSNWAGSITTLEGNGTFGYVSSTVYAPDLSGQVGSSGVALIGIDGTPACLGGMLQLGVMFNIAVEGPSYLAAYRYGNESEGFFTNVDIIAGDAIKLMVSAPVDATLGFVMVKNLRNNQTATQQFNSTERLCGKTAEWIVESLVIEDPKSPLVNFGTVTFADVQVGGGKDFGPQTDSILNIIENGKVLTSVSVEDDSVLVKYL